MKKAKSKTATATPIDRRENSMALPERCVDRRRGVGSATAVLCAAAFVQAYMLVSIFPYSAYMAVRLLNVENDANNDSDVSAAATSKVTLENAGPYAGLLASSFMIGRTLTAHRWGILADAYGRRWALVASLVLSSMGSIAFGTASTYFGAAVARFVLGACNSIVGITKTMATEVAVIAAADSADESHGTANGSHTLETRIVGAVVGTRAWGFLIAPALGGFLADPVGQYGWGASADGEGGIHDRIGLLSREVLQRYPYLLPNLVGAIFSLAAALAVAYGIDETLPEDQRRDSRLIFSDAMRCVRNRALAFVERLTSVRRRLSRLKWSSSPRHGSTVEKGSETTFLVESSQPNPSTCTNHNLTVDYGGGNGNGIDDTAKIATNEPRDPHPSPGNGGGGASASVIWSLPSLRQHLLAYWLYSFIVVTIDEAFPLYCVSRTGGMGWSESSVGAVLSAAGLLFALGQYVAYVRVVDRWGVYGSLSVACWCGVVPVALMPISLLLFDDSALPGNDDDDDATETFGSSSLLHRYCRAPFLFLAILMGATKIFQSAFFSSITVATNRTVPAGMRSSVNGFASAGASIAKGLGPLFAGTAVAFCLSWGGGDEGGNNAAADNDYAYWVIAGPRAGAAVVFMGIGSLGIAMLGALPRSGDT